MELTKEFLLDFRQNAVNQQQHYLQMVQQAKGAIDTIDYLIAQLERPETESQNAINAV
jgi:hypothetical protein